MIKGNTTAGLVTAEWVTGKESQLQQRQRELIMQIASELDGATVTPKLLEHLRKLADNVEQQINCKRQAR